MAPSTTEWMLHPDVHVYGAMVLGTPAIDLFSKIISFMHSPLLAQSGDVWRKSKQTGQRES